jgi:hypothetical protein
MRPMMNLESVINYGDTRDIHTLIVRHKITGIGAY